jgi:zinc protease
MRALKTWCGGVEVLLMESLFAEAEQATVGAAVPSTIREMPIQRIGDIDGIPAVWVPALGLTNAGLVFRVGQLDENLRGRGLTHLIEHLALSNIKTPTYAFNGVTGWWTTSFLFHGKTEEAVTYFSEVVRALSNLPFERMNHEAQILKTESCQRGMWPTSSVLLNMFGASGPGVLAYPEFGLRALETQSLDAWRSKHFTKSNACFWFSGPEAPPAMNVDLPIGNGYVPLPAVEVIDRLPGWVNVQGDRVTVTAIVKNTPALGATLRTLENRLTERLRHEEGLSYNISTSRSSFSAVSDAVFITADHREGDGQRVFDVMSNELARMGSEEVTAAELDSWSVSVDRYYVHELDAAASLASGSAEAMLLHAPVESAPDHIRAAQNVSADQVCSVAEELRNAAAWGLPFGSSVDDQRIAAFAAVSAWRAKGEVFPRIAENDATTQAVVFQREGISLAWSGDSCVSVQFDSLELLSVEGPASLWLIDSSGFGISIKANEWHDGARLVELILHAVDSTKVTHATSDSKRAEVTNLAADLADVGAAAVAGNVAKAEKVRWWWAVTNRSAYRNDQKLREVTIPYQTIATWTPERFATSSPAPGGRRQLVSLKLGVPKQQNKVRRIRSLEFGGEQSIRLQVSKAARIRTKLAILGLVLATCGPLAILLGAVGVGSGTVRLGLVATLLGSLAIVTKPVRVVATSATGVTIRTESIDSTLSLRRQRILSCWVEPEALQQSQRFSSIASLTAVTAEALRKLLSLPLNEVIAALAPLSIDERYAVLASASETPDGRRHLERLALEEAGAAFSEVLLGMKGIGEAWASRGHGWGSTVSRSSADAFLHELRVAEARFVSASKLDPNGALCRIGLLVTARGLMVPQAERIARYHDVVRVAPESFFGAAMHVQGLAPKWGGDQAALLAFSDSLITTYGVDHPLAAIATAAHIELWISDVGKEIGLLHASRLTVLSHATERFERDASFVNTIALNYAAGAVWCFRKDSSEAKAALRLLGQRLTAVPWGYYPGGPQPSNAKTVVGQSFALKRSKRKSRPKVKASWSGIGAMVLLRVIVLAFRSSGKY